MRGYPTAALLVLAAAAGASLPLPPAAHMVLELDAARVERDALLHVLDAVECSDVSVDETGLDATVADKAFAASALGGLAGVTVAWPAPHRIHVALTQGGREAAHEMAMDDELRTLHLNTALFFRATVKREGDSIVVDILDYRDLGRLRALFGDAPRLALRPVAEDGESATMLPSREAGKPAIAVTPEEIVSPSHIERAWTGRSKLSGSPIVHVRFDAAGREAFAAYTRDHVGHRLAVVLDGVVLMAPTIEQSIPGGETVIEGSLAPWEAEDIAREVEAAAHGRPFKLVELKETP